MKGRLETIAMMTRRDFNIGLLSTPLVRAFRAVRPALPLTASTAPQMIVSPGVISLSVAFKGGLTGTLSLAPRVVRGRPGETITI